MQSILVRRLHQNDKQTKGELELYSPEELIFVCKTLELPWRDNQKNISRIPSDGYNAVKHESPKFGECVWIKGVPNRSEILIHKGNFAGSVNPRTGISDIKGCILVGKDFIDIDGDGLLDITNSVDTMNDLLELLDDEFQVLVQDIFYKTE